MEDYLSRLKFSRSGDFLIIKLMDSNYNTYFNEKARLGDKKKMAEIKKKLQEKGIGFPANWFD